MKDCLYKFVIILCLCCATPGLLSAQATKVMIRGVITAEFDKEPLPGANVLLVNKDNRVTGHATTDMDGNYSMLVEVRAGDKLSVSYTGMKTNSTPVKGNTTINIALEEDAVMLEGAVITAKKKISNGLMNINERDLTTSATRISIADLADNMSGAGVDDALQGRIAGVDIVAGTGAPGAGMSIRIRGTTSINGSSQPLIVVDGFPYETEISSDFDFATADEEQYSQMLNIAPDDIKEITVLKDAAATAIWGSRAANGVLQITTKRGSVSKPRVSYTFKGTMAQRPEGISTLSGDQYSTMIQEAIMNSGSLYSPINYPEFAYDVNQPYYFYNYGQNTNWFREVTQVGLTQEHNASISGGGAKAQYRASIGYFDQTGTTIGTDYSRITTRLNVDYNVSEKIKFQASMSYVHGNNNKNYISYLDKKKDVGDMAYLRMPNMSIYEYNAAGILTGNYFSPLNSPQGYWNSNSTTGGVYNPVAMANEGIFNYTSDRITSNLSLVYSPLTWLRYQFDVSLDILNDKTKAFLPQTATGRPWNEISVNRADDLDSEAFVMQTFNKLLLTPSIGDKHSLQALLGVNSFDKSANSFKATTGNNASPSLTDPSDPSRVSGSNILGINSGSTQNRLISFLGNLQYGFLDRYFVNGSIRNDGSSRFGKNYRWGTFPSISGRWRVSGEPLLKGTEKWLDELSLRVSYGVNGAQSKYDYAHISTYNIYDYTYLGESGSYPSNLELKDLRWERTVQSNFGLNFSAFKNRLSIDVDIYKKRTNDLFFYNLKVPSSTGFKTVNMNAGIMDNQGFEISVNTVPVRTKDWTVSFNVNIARNQNYIREISEQYPNEKGVTTANGSYIRRFEVDQPLGSVYGYKYKGVYLNEDQTIARDNAGNKIYTYDEKGTRIPVQMKFGYPSIAYQFEAGDARYEDINNDGNIDYQDIVYLGNVNPLFTGGFGPSVKYKNWSLNGFFNFRYGNKIINSSKMEMEKMHSFDNQSTSVLKRWRHSYDNEADAPTDLLPRALYKSGYNWLGSDRYVEDGSFIRFKSLTLKYMLSKKQLNKSILKECSFWVTANDLYVWTNYSGLDPEVSIGGSDPFASGYDTARTPRTLTMTFGVNLSF